MNIHLATDHAGFDLKNILKKHLEENNDFEIIDHGALEKESGDDYPDFIRPAAKAVTSDIAAGKESLGIVLGGSGQGEAMFANKFSGIRCVVYYGKNEEIVKLSREHNDANMLSLGARFITEEEMIRVVNLWLSSQFSGDERHVRRIAKMN